MLLPVIHSVSDEQEASWDMRSHTGWPRRSGGFSRIHAHTTHRAGDPETSTLDELDSYEFADLDVAHFDDEPGMVELVLAEEENVVMNLDTGQTPIIGGIEED